MTWIQTYTGRKFDLLAPLASMVCIEDIAHHLALTNRFNGATREPYSVGQHSCHVADLLPPSLKRVGLLHDAHEAYLGDWTRPLKIALRQLGVDTDGLVAAINTAIGEAFGVSLNDLPGEVKRADNVMLSTERRDLMRAAPEPWVWLPEPCNWKAHPWGAQTAERVFLEYFARYA